MFSGTQFFVGCFGDVDFYNSNFFQITVMATEVFRALVTESRLARAIWRAHHGFGQIFP